MGKGDKGEVREKRVKKFIVNKKKKNCCGMKEELEEMETE